MPFSIPSFFRTFGRFGSAVVARGEDIVSNDWYEQARAIRWLYATINQAHGEATFWGTNTTGRRLLKEPSTSFVLSVQGFLDLQPGRISVRTWTRYEAGAVRMEFVPVFGTTGSTIVWESALRVEVDGVGEDEGVVALAAGGRYRVDVYLRADSIVKISELVAVRAHEIQMTSAQL